MAAAHRALHVALDLARAPALGAAVRRRELPRGGVLELIRIAAGCTETCLEAAQAVAKPPELIRQATVLYLQHALFPPGANHYRVLGVAPDVSSETLREHYLWLMRWLHPDRNASDWDTVFARRVTVAWDALKSSERRAHYDRKLAERQAEVAAKPASARRGRSGPPWVARPTVLRKRRARRTRPIAIVLGICAAVAAITIPGP